MSDYEFTAHALYAIDSRKINQSWVFDCLQNPNSFELDTNDPSIKHFFKIIPSNGNRVLRVVINFKTQPKKIITAYFDRNKKGKI